MTWVKFPWSDLKKGQGFFVPCLDTYKVKMYGLRAAINSGFRTDAFVGVHKGRLGVFFVRVS